MYRGLKAKDFLKVLNKPDTYKVDGLIISGSGNREKQLTLLHELFKDLEISEYRNLEFDFFKSVIEFKLENKVFWFDNVYGGTYLSELLHVGSLLGSKMNILVGNCGGLLENMESGGIVIPTYSYSEDSSTKLYARGNFDNKHFPNAELIEKVKRLVAPDLKVYEGPIINCQAMLGETWNDVLQWKNEGYIGVEMETSTLFSVSNHFNIPSAAILYMNDNLIKGDLVGGEIHESSIQKRDLARKHNYKLALNLLLSL